MSEITYTWDSLTWKEQKVGVRVAHLSLYPSEVLHIETGWEIVGPIRLTISHNASEKHTKIRYRKLRIERSYT